MRTDPIPAGWDAGLVRRHNLPYPGPENDRAVARSVARWKKEGLLTFSSNGTGETFDDRLLELVDAGGDYVECFHELQESDPTGAAEYAGVAPVDDEAVDTAHGEVDKMAQGFVFEHRIGYDAALAMVERESPKLWERWKHS